MQQRERAEPVLALLRAELEGEAATMVGKGDVGLGLLGLEALLVDGDEEEESSESGSESEDRESESGSGSEGSETDESDDDDGDEEEEGENALVAGLQRVRLVEGAEGTGAGTGMGTGADSGRAEGQEDHAGLVGQLAALSVGGAKPRETLDVRSPPSLLLAPQQPEGEVQPEEGKRRRPLVEEL